ncbi:IclR family transcriptional regulator [Pseudarthrobacter sp. J75]|uniref:IclR family transcriptional regulator n=1 Tax=unclassified Pseudarthrobacter TaxID=2647000 RepID=UPI002E813816|nr:MULTISPECIES: IclR family transcriptional regulator [unclassified Pseudarthrobacter]MEE2521508.1 IclR family transcriptional regulator [Pseudarthrobacter sp. J47]MEE2528740.1 IclR family transcriptional regulator [Pseudarthrobacter sp. J75]
MKPSVTGTSPAGESTASPSQTLSRGIRALEILAAAEQPLTIAELSAALGVHRSVAYRILRTLEDHSLLMRDDAGKVQPGPGLAVLARGVARNLQQAALPELTQLANGLDMTAFIAVWDHLDCTTLVTVEPRHTGGAVAQHPGTRHPIGTGAPGIAIQSALTEEEWQRLAPGVPYRTEAAEARVRGYAASHDEVIPGLSSLAAPIRVPSGRPAALAVVYIGSHNDPSEVGASLVASAARIEGQLA